MISCEETCYDIPDSSTTTDNYHIPLYRISSCTSVDAEKKSKL